MIQASESGPIAEGSCPQPDRFPWVPLVIVDWFVCSAWCVLLFLFFDGFVFDTEGYPLAAGAFFLQALLACLIWEITGWRGRGRPSYFVFGALVLAAVQVLCASTLNSGSSVPASLVGAALAGIHLFLFLYFQFGRRILERENHWTFGFSAALLVIFIFAVSTEVAVRLWVFTTAKSESDEDLILGLRGAGELPYQQSFHVVNSTTETDPVRGWRTRGSESSSFVLADFAGVRYRVDYSTNSQGFRAFGNLESDSPKILFLGDSYTHAYHVSDDKTYYARVGQMLDAEIFAYGVGGYGTCQEMLALEKFLALIDPDIIVWQFCFNDFLDNYRPLGVLSVHSGTPKVRPYMRADGSLYYGVSRKADRLHQFAENYSQGLRLLLNAWVRLEATWVPQEESIESRIAHSGSSFPGFPEAVEVTERIFRRAKAAAGDRPVVAFSVGADAVYSDEITELFRRLGIDLVGRVPARLHEEEARGAVTRADDGGHFNELGNDLCGQEIASYLASRFNVGVRVSAPPSQTADSL